jgi:hypothetical protein
MLVPNLDYEPPPADRVFSPLESPEGTLVTAAIRDISGSRPNIPLDADPQTGQA